MELTSIELNEEKIHKYFSNILDNLESLSRNIKEVVRKKEHLDDYTSTNYRDIVRNIMLETQIKTAAVTGMMTLVEDSPNFHVEFVMAMKGNSEEDMTKAAIGRAMHLYQRYNIDVIDKVEIILPNILKAKEVKSPAEIAISRSKIDNAKDYFKVITQDIRLAVKYIQPLLEEANTISYKIDFAHADKEFPAISGYDEKVTPELIETLKRYIERQTTEVVGRFWMVIDAKDPFQSRCVHISNVYIQGVHFYRFEIKRANSFVAQGIVESFGEVLKKYNEDETAYHRMRPDDKRKMALYLKLVLKLISYVGVDIHDPREITRKKVEELYYDFNVWKKPTNVGGYADPVQAVINFNQKYGVLTFDENHFIRFK